MVKADVRRDYYADLGLAPSAESEEIKKQFRKLALKFHPDRNPGREQEFIAKFQAIQAAHEILSDPQQRIKYDTDRLRAGYGKVYGPPRTNTQRRPQPTQASTASARPQPSKPTYSQWTGPNTTPNGPSAGAQRYSAHARAGPQQWQKKQDDAQTRADAFKGFSGMRGSNAGSWRSFDPGRPPSGSTAGTPRQQNTPFGNQRPKSAYEFFKDSARTANSASPNSAKKKQGFAPGTAGGDEPPARNTSAYTHNRSDRPSSMYFDSVPSPTAKKPPPAPEPPNFPEEFERNRRGYAATSGEKTFFSSNPLGRSSTTRMPSGSFRPSSSRTKPSSPTYPSSNGRRRSASPKPTRKPSVHKVPSETSSSDLYDSEAENSEPIPKHSKPKAVPKSRLRPDQKFSDFHQAGDLSPGTGEEPYRSGRSSQRSQPTPTPANTGTRKSRRQPSFVDLTTDSDENKGHNSDSAAFPRGLNRSQQPAQGSTTRTESTQHVKPAFAAFDSRSSSDASNLHKKFSAEDWRDHLDFDFLGSSTHSTRKSSSSRPQTQSNSRNDSAESMPSTGSPSLNPFGTLHESTQAKSQQAPTPFAQAKFSADEWAKQLNNLSWNIPEPARTRQSANTPPSARSPRKQPKTGSKVRPTPQAASVASEAEEAKETVNGHQTPPIPAQPAPTEAEAMDIDEEQPPSSPEKTASKEAKDTSYPDLNSNAAHGPSSNGTIPPQHNPSPPQAESKSNSEATIPLFNLDNLSKTAPFTNTNSGGIDNLDDVHATLPFESRAKQPVTTKQDIRPRELSLPNPPKRPWAPKLVQMGPNSKVLPLEKWQYYVSAMSTYIHDWNHFNRRMLLHFNTRQEAVETGLSANWISAVGDSARLNINGNDDDTDSEKKADDHSELDEYLIPGRAKGGFSAYLRGIEEDMQVRKHWDVACEMHRECILDLGRLREWIRNGGKVVSFAQRPQYDL